LRPTPAGAACKCVLRVVRAGRDVRRARLRRPETVEERWGPPARPLLRRPGLLPRCSRRSPRS